MSNIIASSDSYLVVKCDGKFFYRDIYQDIVKWTEISEEKARSFKK